MSKLNLELNLKSFADLVAYALQISAENDRLREMLAQSQEENARLRAESERLRRESE